MDLPITRRVQLLHRSISYDTARKEESNILLQLSYPDKRLEFLFQLFENQQTIREIVTGHLKLNNDQSCHLSEFSEWVHGSFNVCIPVYVQNWDRPRVLIRFPLPYKVGETLNPGNMDEKVRSEAATYIWMQENCPDIPVPRLWGFGTGNDLHFTVQNKRCVRLDQLKSLGVSYLLMDFIEVEQGRMLSETWNEYGNDLVKKQTLFRHLSRIMLSLKRKPFAQIGSLTVNDSGEVSLANRPLSVIIPEAENDSCPPIVDRSNTYDTTEPYVMDLFAYHDNRLRYQANSVNSINDGLDQVEALTLLRGSLPNFLDRATRNGPFYLNLTDLHQSNIFVDDSWHITAIIDLEWACTRPIEMLRPPLWLTNQAIDCLVDEKLTEYHQAVEDFLLILEEVEEQEKQKEMVQGQTLLRQKDTLVSILRRNWSTGRLWYFRALDSLTGLMAVFYNHIEPVFESDVGIKTSARFWHPDTGKIIEEKVADKMKYDVQLREAFEEAVKGNSSND